MLRDVSLYESGNNFYGSGTAGKSADVSESIKSDEFHIPSITPWGLCRECETVKVGIYEVCTATGGGLMIDRRLAEKTLSAQILSWAVRVGSYLCFPFGDLGNDAYRELENRGVLS